MTYAEKFEDIIKAVFPEADTEEIMGKTCPYFFFENSDVECSSVEYCSDCWNAEVEEDEE